MRKPRAKNPNRSCEPPIRLAGCLVLQNTAIGGSSSNTGRCGLEAADYEGSTSYGYTIEANAARKVPRGSRTVAEYLLALT